MKTVTRPRVAIVRGPYLNPFEMQTYAQLLPRFDLTAFAAHDNLFDDSRIGFPVVHLLRPKQIGFDIPRWRGFCNLTTRFMFGSEERMLGLERALVKFDLVHAAETYNYFSLQAIRLKAKTGIPVALTVWDNIPHNHEAIRSISLCKQEVRENADMFLAVTEQAMNALISEGVPASRIRVVGAGIDVDRFKPGPANFRWRTRFGLAGDEAVILYVGSLLKSKGVRDLLAAAQLLREWGISQKKPFRVLLIGQGPEASQLRMMTRQLGLNQMVIFGGSICYDDMPEIHRLADIFVLPSIPTPTWEEQFGMVLAESMATGKAVVSTLSGAIPEVVGDAGVLVPPGNPAALAHALHELLRDGAWRGELGQRAHQRVVSSFAHHLVAERIACAYRSLLNV